MKNEKEIEEPKYRSDDGNSDSGVLLTAAAAGTVGYILGSRTTSVNLNVEGDPEIVTVVTGSETSIVGVPQNIFGMLDTTLGVGDRSNFMIAAMTAIVPILAGRQKHKFYKNWPNYEIGHTVEAVYHHIFGRLYGAASDTSGEGKRFTSVNAHTLLSTEDIGATVLGATGDINTAKKLIRPGGTSFISMSYQGWGLLLSAMDLGTLLAYMAQYPDGSLLNKLNRYNIPISEQLFDAPTADFVKQLYAKSTLLWYENRFRPIYGYYRKPKAASSEGEIRAMIKTYLELNL